jgi:hypothetical protein
VPKALNEREAKLVQWLGEAHSKEAELDAELGRLVKELVRTEIPRDPRPSASRSRSSRRATSSPKSASAAS